MEFHSKNELLSAFPNERSCLMYLEKLLWNGIPVSPFVINSKVYYCKNNRYKCRDSGQYFNVKTNTIFHNSKISLQKWFTAIWLLSNSESAISSVQLAKELNITQKSAWYMMRRIKSQFASQHTPIYIKPEKIAVRDNIEEINVYIEPDKLKMSDWLQTLKK